MKKIFTILFAAGIMVLGSTQNARAQAVEQGNFMIALQYGYPNLFTFALKSAYDQSGGYEEVKIGGIGPVGFQAEYMVADKIGVGLKFNYTNSTVEYDYDDYDANMNPVTYHYKLSIPRLRIMPRFSFHFGNSDNFDGYAGIAAGYSSFSVKYESDDPDYTGDVAFSSLTPFGFRLDVGGNYFFTDNIGINFELGIGGGPIMNGGVVFKF